MEPASKYVEESKIGKGAFSTVFKGYDKEKKFPVAIKRIIRWEEDSVIEREISILKKLRHPNIVNLIDFEKSEEYYCIVLEYCEHGDLQQFIQKKTTDGKLPEWQAQRLFQQIFKGMGAVYAQNIVHRDLKLENVLIDENYVPKIADFGWSRLYEKKNSVLSTYCGTPISAAPEILRREESYDEKCDIWSLGVMLYKVLLGRFPYTIPKQASPMDLLREIDEKNPFAGVQELSEPVLDLLKAMLTVDPRKRISFNQIMTHNWATGLNLYPSLKFEQSGDLVALNGLTNWVNPFSPEEKEFYFSRLQAKETIIDYIAQGQPVYQDNAVIYAGVDCNNNKREIAIKIYKDSPLYSNICSREWRILSKINHPNIIKCYGYYKDSQGKSYLVYEWCANGNMEAFIKKNFPERAIPEHQTQKVAQQIFAGMKCLKEKSLVHRELQLKNIFVTENYTLKLAGFDAVLEENEVKAEMKKTKEFLITTAPGASEKREFSEKNEVWALGMMLYQILVGSPPFKLPVNSSEDILKQVKQPNWLQFPENASVALKILLTSMLTVDPGKRANFQTLFSNPWLTGSFNYYRLRVTVEGIFSDLISENYTAEEWFPSTDAEFKMNYPLIMMSLAPEVSTQSEARIEERCSIF